MEGMIEKYQIVYLFNVLRNVRSICKKGKITKKVSQRS